MKFLLRKKPKNIKQKKQKNADTGKSPDISGLQHDRERQSLPDPAHRQKIAKRRSKLYPLSDDLFEGLNLCFNTPHHREIGFDRINKQKRKEQNKQIQRKKTKEKKKRKDSA